LSGDDLTQLVGEVEKAALAGGPDNRRVGVAEVRAVVGEHRLRHVFDLTRALTARDTGGALALLESLLNAGEEPLAVLGMLAREARATWQVAGALRAGRPAEDIARSLRRPPAPAAPAPRLLAGATSVTVSLPDDTPLGGYGGFPRRAWLPDLIGRYPDTFWFRPATGQHDPIKVRALVLEAGSVRVLWLSLD